MKKYNFIRNVNKHIQEKEDAKKKEELGKIISSLQKPFKQVLQAVCEKQQKDVNELLKYLKWPPYSK